MKILHLNDEPWDSGITAYAANVARLLQENGHEVIFGVKPGKKPEKIAKELGLATAPAGNLWQAARIIKSKQWNIINVHTGRTHTWAVLAGRVCKKVRRIPLVRTRGDSRPLQTTALNKFVYRNTTSVISLSDHIRKQYETDLGFSEEKARTIYPFVLPALGFVPPPMNRVGVLGRLDPVKGHTIFLEAAAKVLKDVPDARFLVAGKEANVTVPLLQNHVRELGIEGAVRFLGYQPSAQEFMQTCSVGVIPSLGSEEVSRVCLEWMSVGRPVIGTLVGSLPELIEIRETGLLVPPGDSDALAAAITKVFTESFLLAKWGKAGMDLIKRRFSPRVQLEKTLRAYNWAVQNHGRQ